MNKKIFMWVIILVIVLVLGAYFIIKSNNFVPVSISGNVPTVSVLTNTSLLGSYSLANISLHNKAGDCWMVIGGKVYNATSYIALGQHKPIIVNGCGLDATSMFSQVDKHQGSKAQSILPTLQIGILK